MSQTHFAGRRRPDHRRLAGLAAGVLLAVMLGQSPAQAQAQVRPGELQGAIPVLALGTMESQEGETKVQFLHRVGRILEGYTNATGMEACGIIADRRERQEGQEGKWLVPLVTQQSHMACAAALTFPDDATVSGETIHSHPHFGPRGFRANAADVAFFRGLQGKNLRRGEWVAVARGKGHSEFSEADFRAGAGWLVADGQLFFQSGWGKVVNHGNIHAQSGGADLLPAPYLPGVAMGSIAMVDLVSLDIPGLSMLPHTATAQVQAPTGRAPGL